MTASPSTPSGNSISPVSALPALLRSPDDSKAQVFDSYAPRRDSTGVEWPPLCGREAVVRIVTKPAQYADVLPSELDTFALKELLVRNTYDKDDKGLRELRIFMQLSKLRLHNFVRPLDYAMSRSQLDTFAEPAPVRREGNENRAAAANARAPQAYAPPTRSKSASAAESSTGAATTPKKQTGARSLAAAAAAAALTEPRLNSAGRRVTAQPQYLYCLLEYAGKHTLNDLRTKDRLSLSEVSGACELCWAFAVVASPVLLGATARALLLRLSPP